jgi:hypothetical protein
MGFKKKSIKHSYKHICYYNEKNIINSYNVNACQLSYMQNTKKKKGWNKDKDI